MIDGTLEDRDAERLAELLEENAEARAVYRNIIDVHARLLLQYEEAPAFEDSTTETTRTETDSPWWQFVAVALALLAGLNLIQSAGNLTAAQPFESAPAELRAAPSLSQLKQELNLEPATNDE